MTSQNDWDCQVSGSKIEPLESPTKTHIPRDRRGSVGEDFDIEHSHIAPLDSPIKEAPHPDMPVEHALKQHKNLKQEEKAEDHKKIEDGLKGSK